MPNRPGIVGVDRNRHARSPSTRGSDASRIDVRLELVSQLLVDKARTARWRWRASSRTADRAPRRCHDRCARLPAPRIATRTCCGSLRHVVFAAVRVKRRPGKRGPLDQRREAAHLEADVADPRESMPDEASRGVSDDEVRRVRGLCLAARILRTMPIRPTAHIGMARTVHPAHDRAVDRFRSWASGEPSAMKSGE